MLKPIHGLLAALLIVPSVGVSAAERTLIFSGYVDGVHAYLGDRIKVDDPVVVVFKYDWDGLSFSDNGDYRSYNDAFKSGYLTAGSYRIDFLDGYGSSVYTQDSEPGTGPDRFITSFSDIPARALNGYGVWDTFVSFDDGSGTALSRNALPLSDQDLRGFVRAGMAIDFGPSGAYRVGAVLSNFAFSNAPVPEMTTWAMMLLGFGLSGTAMRRISSPIRETVAKRSGRAAPDRSAPSL